MNRRLGDLALILVLLASAVILALPVAGYFRQF